MPDEQKTMDADMPSDATHMDALQQERDTYLAGWKRAQADYANLLKETEKARREFIAYAKEDVLLRILPAVDQYEVALQFQPPLDGLPEHARRSFETWITGLYAVKALWEQAAKELGLEPVNSEGALDPACHEAVAEEFHSNIASGNIIKVVQSGWWLSGKLLRPAKVIISKGSEETSSVTQHP